MEYILFDDELREVARFKRKSDAIKKANEVMMRGERVAIELHQAGLERPMYLNPDGSIDTSGKLWGDHDRLATAIRLLKLVHRLQENEPVPWELQGEINHFLAQICPGMDWKQG